MMTWTAARSWLWRHGWTARRDVLRATFPDGVTEQDLIHWALANRPPAGSPRP
jgi:hypothetical protein